MHDVAEKIVGEDFDVFISYAHADEEAASDRGPAQALAAMLEADGYSVWWDRQLLAGKDWARELAVKVGFARKVIALCSPKWLASEWCQKEEFRAYEKEGKLIPVVIEDCALPDRIARLQQVKATGNLILYKHLIVAALAIPPSNAPTAQRPSRLSADDIWLEGLPTGTAHLFGREKELKTLLDAWNRGEPGDDLKAKTNAVVLHAIGGAGKSALLRRFLDALEEKGYPGALKVYGWSAYSQGSGENRNADADAFISKALKFFGHDIDAKPITDPVERGRTLARLVRRQRTLLVLDGLEPLQDLPHVNEGRLKDRGLQALVTQLARENPGLVVITSRQELPELARFASPAEDGKPEDKHVINHALENLDERAGAELLKHLGVHGREKELRAAVNEVGGHALSVSLLGTYLSAICAGDVARRDTLRFHELVDKRGESAHDRQARRASRIMDAYVERFEQLPKGEADTERMILSLIGLFDRPAEQEALDVVLAGPPIAGLTDGWHALSAHERSLGWTFALQRLRALKLIAAEGVRPSGSDTIAPTGLVPPAGLSGTATSRGAMVSDPEGLTPAHGLDAHPVVRQHFGRRLKEAAPDAFREANWRLYEHYKALPEKLWGKELPDTLDEMQPLFAAIAHGCAAGLQTTVWEDVYWPRILRGNEKYLVHKLGGLASDLGLLAHMFQQLWQVPSANLRASRQALVLNFAGFALRALGRLREAVEPMRANVRMRVEQEAWRNAAIGASGLSELLLTLGDVGPAVAAAREGAVFAEKTGDASRRMINLAALADALHQAGDPREAAALFAEAERLQKEDQPGLPRLYSLRGYIFCDLLLGQGRHAEVAERAAEMIEGEAQDPLLSRALYRLALGRAAHQTWSEGKRRNAWHTPTPNPSPQGGGEQVAQGGGGAVTTARRHLDAAVEGLRKAGEEIWIARGLLARAAFRRDTGEWEKVQEDLDETFEIASRGGMRLHLADTHLERGRLLLAQIPQPTVERGWFGRAKTIAPVLSAQHRTLLRDAEQAGRDASDFIQATGYHRRDGELAELRKLLKALGAQPPLPLAGRGRGWGWG